MENDLFQFLDKWNAVNQILGLVVLGISFTLYGNHFIQLIRIRDFKLKYDYINRNEIRALKNGTLFLMIGSALLFNAFVEETGSLWLALRVFITAGVSVMILILVYTTLTYYYPKIMEKRLNDLRYKPRTNPKTGNKMKLLSEEEEDVYLDEGMQAEEALFSVDYDVWVDEKTGDTLIEKYAGHQHTKVCPNCNYQTFKIVKEVLIKRPTVQEPGLIMRYYLCHFCGFKDSKEVTVTPGKKDPGDL